MDLYQLCDMLRDSLQISEIISAVLTSLEYVNTRHHRLEEFRQACAHQGSILFSLVL